MRQLTKLNKHQVIAIYNADASVTQWIMLITLTTFSKNQRTNSEKLHKGVQFKYNFESQENHKSTKLTEGENTIKNMSDILLKLI